MSNVNFIPEKRRVRGTPAILKDDGKRPSAEEFFKGDCQFTERMENFYRNLLAMYRATASKVLPVYFKTADGSLMRMDRGCIGHAVADGFLEPLENDTEGHLLSVRLGW